MKSHLHEINNTRNDMQKQVMTCQKYASFYHFLNFYASPVEMEQVTSGAFFSFIRRAWTVLTHDMSFQNDNSLETLESARNKCKHKNRSIGMR